MHIDVEVARALQLWSTRIDLPRRSCVSTNIPAKDGHRPTRRRHVYLRDIPGPYCGKAAQEEITRKVKTKTQPVYPELAKRMNISGTVKLQVVVAPNGTRTAKIGEGIPCSRTFCGRRKEMAV